MIDLDFSAQNYTIKTIDEKSKFKYRSFLDITYVAQPVDPIQKLNVFAPEIYFQGGSINGYTLETAPIFMPNTVGGYMPGQRDFPDNTAFNNGAATISAALKRGYVVVSVGIRGRSLVNAAGKNVGKAPADDHVFAVSAYCPIHNLAHADAAYEWQFNGINDFHRMHINFTAAGKPDFTPWDGQLTQAEQVMSLELKRQFISYVNELHLKDTTGRQLTLDATGKGSFLDVIKQQLQFSAQRAIDQGDDLSEYSWLKLDHGQVIGLDWSQYLQFITRMKGIPAFDALDLDSPECNEFGTEKIDAKHFTQFSQVHTIVPSELAEPVIVGLLNPIQFIMASKTDLAGHWRIRHGAADRDTSFAIPIILTLSLQNKGIDVDFALPWGKPHSGDYDLPDLFAWIDGLCK